MQLHYKSFGTGAPVLILHGLLGSLDNWQTFARKLAPHFTVFTVDLRNHGKSPHSPEHSYAAMTADLLEFFAQHHLPRAHLIGHSMGGKLAMHFALAHPEKILKLIVVDIAPKKYNSGHDAIFEALSTLHLAPLTKREEADRQLAAKIEDPAVRQFLLKNLDRKTDGTFAWKMNLGALQANYEKINAAIEPNPTAPAPAPLPALLIRGGKSRYVLDEDFPSFQRLFPHAQLHTIAAAGHWVHADAPEAFFTAVHHFLMN